MLDETKRNGDEMKRLSVLIVVSVVALVGCGAGEDAVTAQPGVVVEPEQAAAPVESQVAPTIEAEVEAEAVQSEPVETAVDSTAVDSSAVDSSAVDSSADDPELDPGASDEERALNFARCMRDEGVNFPDPAVNADGSIDMLGNGTPGSLQPNSDSFQSATEVCGPIVAGASFLPGADIDEAVAQENLLAFAQCLRDLGFDVIDPKLSDVLADGPGALARAFGENFDPTDPANADAVQECQRVIQGNANG